LFIVSESLLQKLYEFNQKSKKPPVETGGLVLGLMLRTSTGHFRHNTLNGEILFKNQGRCETRVSLFEGLVKVEKRFFLKT